MEAGFKREFDSMSRCKVVDIGMHSNLNMTSSAGIMSVNDTVNCNKAIAINSTYSITTINVAANVKSDFTELRIIRSSCV